MAAKDGSIAALLGASPGASTAAPIMLDLLQKVFAEKLATPEWQEKVRTMVPSYGVNLNENPDMLAKEWAATAERLQLTLAPPAIDMSAITKPGVSAPAADIKRVPDMAL